MKLSKLYISAIASLVVITTTAPQSFATQVDLTAIGDFKESRVLCKNQSQEIEVDFGRDYYMDLVLGSRTYHPGVYVMDLTRPQGLDGYYIGGKVLAALPLQDSVSAGTYTGQGSDQEVSITIQENAKCTERDFQDFEEYLRGDKKLDCYTANVEFKHIRLYPFRGVHSPQQMHCVLLPE